MLTTTLLVSMLNLISFSDCTVRKDSPYTLPDGAIAGPRILAKAPDPILYDGDNVNEFLGLCPKGCDQKTCNLVRPDPDTRKCNGNDLKLLAKLKSTQNRVKEFQLRLDQDIGERFVLSIWFGIIIIMGLYLIAVKHFHFKTLFDSHYPDPTYGMALWTFQRMKFAVAEVEAKDQQNKEN